MECVGIPIADVKHQESRKDVYIHMSLSVLCHQESRKDVYIHMSLSVLCVDFSRSCSYQPCGGLKSCQNLRVEDGDKGHTHE